LFNRDFYSFIYLLLFCLLINRFSMAAILLRFVLSPLAFFLAGPFQFLVGLCISSGRPRSRDPPCPRRARGASRTASPDARAEQLLPFRLVPSLLVVARDQRSWNYTGYVSLQDRTVYSYDFFLE